MWKFYIYFVLILVDRLNIKDWITLKTLFLFYIYFKNLDHRYFYNSMTFSIFVNKYYYFSNISNKSNNKYKKNKILKVWFTY